MVEADARALADLGSGVEISQLRFLVSRRGVRLDHDSTKVREAREVRRAANNARPFVDFVLRDLRVTSRVRDPDTMPEFVSARPDLELADHLRLPGQDRRRIPRQVAGRIGRDAVSRDRQGLRIGSDVELRPAVGMQRHIIAGQ